MSLMSQPPHPHAEHSTGEHGAPALRLLFWETTAGCNLDCVHCRRLDVSHELMKNDLTPEEGRRLIDQVAGVGRPILVFSGGEPLMRPDLFDLAGHAKEHGLLIALATNGTLVDDALARRIAQAGFDRVSISLDGADAATHDTLRAQVGSFDRAVGALQRLRDQGVATQVNCTIARHNRDQVRDLLDLAGRVGAVAVHYFLLVPVGCGEEIAEDQMLSAEEVEERLHLIARLAEETPLQIKPTCAPHYYRIIRQDGGTAHKTGHPGKEGSLHSMTKGCLAATAVCFVSHEGEVFPCGYLPVSAGNVREQDFGEIWTRSEVFESLRDPSALTGKCGRCEFKMVCSGCRARAFYQFGDFLAEEPACAFEPTRKS